MASIRTGSVVWNLLHRNSKFCNCLKQPNQHGDTVLHLAVVSQDLPTISCLLRHGEHLLHLPFMGSAVSYYSCTVSCPFITTANFTATRKIDEFALQSLWAVIQFAPIPFYKSLY